MLDPSLVGYGVLFLYPLREVAPRPLEARCGTAQRFMQQHVTNSSSCAAEIDLVILGRIYNGICLTAAASLSEVEGEGCDPDQRKLRLATKTVLAVSPINMPEGRTSQRPTTPETSSNHAPNTEYSTLLVQKLRLLLNPMTRIRFLTTRNMPFDILAFAPPHMRILIKFLSLTLSLFLTPVNDSFGGRQRLGPWLCRQ